MRTHSEELRSVEMQNCTEQGLASYQMFLSAEDLMSKTTSLEVWLPTRPLLIITTLSKADVKVCCIFLVPKWYIFHIWYITFGGV